MPLHQTTSKWDLKLLLHESAQVSAHRGIGHWDQFTIKPFKSALVLMRHFVFQKLQRELKAAGERWARWMKTTQTSCWPSNCPFRSPAESGAWREGWRGEWIWSVDWTGDRREGRVLPATWMMSLCTLSTWTGLREPEAPPSPLLSWTLLAPLTGQTPLPSLPLPAPSPSLPRLPPSVQSCWSWEIAL